MSGHTERGREGERETDFEAIESQLALRRLYTRHKPRTPSHLPLPPPLYTTSPRSLLHHLWPSRPDRGPQTDINPPLSRMASHSSQTCSRYQQIHRCFFPFSVFNQCTRGLRGRMCEFVCVCVCVFVCFCVCMCVCGWVVMLPWRVPCSPDEGFLKKRGMPARCTSVGVMLGVGVGVCERVCAL